MTFRKRFNTMSRSTKKNRSITANNWWTHITKIMTKLADKELAVLTPDEHTSFWNGEDRHLNNYLHFLISSIQTIDKELDVGEKWAGIRDLKQPYKPIPYAQKALITFLILLTV